MSGEEIQQKKKERINNVVMVLILVFTILVELVQFLLDLTVFLSPISMLLGFLWGLVLVIWFALLGVKFMGKNSLLKVGTILGASIVTIIPEIDALPELTAEALVLIFQTKIEDAAQNLAVSAKGPEREDRRRAALSRLRERRETRAAQEQELLRAANDNEDEEEERKAA